MANLAAAELVELIIGRAPELRRAGILDITIGDFHATLAPHQEEAAPQEDKRSGVPIDPLLDPHTYGLPEGSRLPGLSHLEVVPEEGTKQR